MGKAISWICLIWNAIALLFGLLVVGVGVFSAMASGATVFAWLVAAVIFVGGPGLGIATALVGARILKGRAPAGQVARVFD